MATPDSYRSNPYRMAGICSVFSLEPLRWRLNRFSFWTSVLTGIYFLKMKHRNWLSYLILFSLFFPMGFWTGRQISPHHHQQGFSAFLISPKGSETKYPVPVQVSKPEDQASDVELAQTNFLILFVDDLSAQTTVLTSAWLLIHPGDSSRLIFLPIFQENKPAEDLVSTFQLDDRNLNKRFIKAIENRKLLWNAFVVIDRRAIEQMTETFETSIDQETFPSLALFKAICQNLPVQSQTLSGIKPLISKHLTANFDLEASLDLWQYRLAAQPSLQCEFPTTSP